MAPKTSSNLVTQKHVQPLAEDPGAHPHPDPGRLVAQTLDDPGEDVDRARVAGRDVELAREVLVIEFLGKDVGDVVHSLHQRHRQPIEALAGLCQGDARAVALEQDGFQLMLELAHMKRNGGLARQEMLGRLSHAPELRGMAERTELPEPVPLVVELPAVRNHDYATPRNAGSMIRMNRSAASEGLSLRRMITPYLRFGKYRSNRILQSRSLSVRHRSGTTEIPTPSAT